MKGGRRLGGKINTSSSAAKKLLSTIRVMTTELRKAKPSAFQGNKKYSTFLNGCIPIIVPITLWESCPLLLIILKPEINFWTKTILLFGSYWWLPNPTLPNPGSQHRCSHYTFTLPFYLQYLIKQRSVWCKSFSKIPLMLSLIKKKKKSFFLLSWSLEIQTSGEHPFLFQIQQVLSSVDFGMSVCLCE